MSAFIYGGAVCLFFGSRWLRVLRGGAI